MEYKFEEAPLEEKFAKTVERLRLAEYENLQLKKALLELQYKLLPLQHKEVSLLIEEFEKTMKPSDNQTNLNNSI